MSLSALPTFLLVPPANLLLTACAGAFYHRHLAGRAVLAASLTLLVVLAVPAVSHTLLVSLETGLPLAIDSSDPPAAIVVLSADEEERWDTGAPAYDIGFVTLARERAAAALERRTGLPLLLSGGHMHSYTPALADMMAASLHDDFAAPATWLEDRSLDTWQNAEFSAAILRAHNITSVYVVTHAWHMRRALIAFRHFGIRVTAAPVLIDAPLRLRLDALVPDTQSLEVSYYALHEWIGCFWYRLRA